MAKISSKKLKKRINEVISATSSANDREIMLQVYRIVEEIEAQVKAKKRDKKSAGLCTQICAYCENEATIKWDTEADGYDAYCPVCGHEIKLRDHCHTPTDSPLTSTS